MVLSVKPNQTNTMNIEETLKSKKGQFTRAAWVRDCKVKVGAPSIRKATVMTVRAGIEYDNMKVVKDKRESGELPAENAGLPWGEWEVYPYLIQHHGIRYARLYPMASSNTQVAYFMDGKERTFEEVEQYLLASEKRKQKGDCITVKLADLVELY